MDANKHNHATTAYYLLLKRYHHNGGRSKADINSETFEKALLIPKQKQPKNNSICKILSKLFIIVNESLHHIEKHHREKSSDKHDDSFINNFINSKSKKQRDSAKYPEK